MFACERGACSHTPATIGYPTSTCVRSPTHSPSLALTPGARAPNVLTHTCSCPPVLALRRPLADTGTLVVHAAGHHRTHHALRRTLADCCASRWPLSHSSRTPADAGGLLHRPPVTVAPITHSGGHWRTLAHLSFTDTPADTDRLVSLPHKYK
jgi:hypothetical protein